MSMKKINFYCRRAVTGFLTAGIWIGVPQSAGASFIGEQMNRMYDEIISNHTEPGAYRTARRVVLSGGGTRIRTRLMDLHPVTVEPPSISAGCGGINLFTGSFSFINSEQWIQFARAVASNAVSYAF